MKLLQYLNESFDSPYPFKWIDIPFKDDMYFKGEFSSKNNDFILTMYNPLKVKWELSFRTKKGDSYDLTNQGDAFKIFATVIAMAKDAIQIINDNPRAEIKLLYFSADKTNQDDYADDLSDGNSRSKLYSRMIKRYINPKNIKINHTYDSVEFYISL